MDERFISEGVILEEVAKRARPGTTIHLHSQRRNCFYMTVHDQAQLLGRGCYSVLFNDNARDTNGVLISQGGEGRSLRVQGVRATQGSDPADTVPGA